MSQADVVHNRAIELPRDASADRVHVESLLRAVVEISQLLLAAPDLNSALPAVLAVLLRAAPCGRVVVCGRDALLAQWHHLAHVQLPGTVPYDSTAFPLPEASFPEVVGELLADRCWTAARPTRAGAPPAVRWRRPRS